MSSRPLLQGLHDGVDVMADHADVSPFRRAVLAHRVRKELAADNDLVVLRPAPFNEGANILVGNRRLDEHGLDPPRHEEVDELIDFLDPRLALGADALDAADL